MSELLTEFEMEYADVFPSPYLLLQTLLCDRVSMF